jgi:hypothetical protein
MKKPVRRTANTKRARRERLVNLIWLVSVNSIDLHQYKQIYHRIGHSLATSYFNLFEREESVNQNSFVAHGQTVRGEVIKD